MENIKANVLAVVLLAAIAVRGEVKSLKMLEGEHWWGAANAYGAEMPFDVDSSFSIDLNVDNGCCQAASLMLSDMGRVMWCEEQTKIAVDGGLVTMRSKRAPVETIETGGGLRDAFLAASRRFFPPSGKCPDPLFFSAPQYNTWIELTYCQNERGIIDYAQSMIDNGLPPGVLMIDDTWQAGYGDWRFEPSRFPDPKGMVEKLHAMGFKVMLWVCPFVGMDTPAFRRIAWGVNPLDVKGWPEKGGFLMRGDSPAAVKWWNGYSALLDFTHPNARAWFKETLDGLVCEYGIDGFKFDGGEVEFYSQGLRAFAGGASSGEQMEAYAKFALMFPACEYRNAWRFQEQPVVERLHDKDHSWKALRRLVPDMIAGGFLGHPFMCPDMIGGGSWTAFLPGSPFDAELFVRSAQVHALCGMMQFSASPWRVLDAEKRQIVRDLVKMRQDRFASRFVALASECGASGEPMIRNLEYAFPGLGYCGIKDQFMMGDFLIVAPVVEKGARTRRVTIPPGRWRGDDGKTVEGPATIEVPTPLERLPYFVRLSFSADDSACSRTTREDR